MITTIWLLLAQGSGVSSSAITIINKYSNEQSCIKDGERLKTKFYVSYFCLETEEKK